MRYYFLNGFLLTSSEVANLRMFVQCKTAFNTHEIFNRWRYQRL
jgi:hypothetical protein